MSKFSKYDEELAMETIEDSGVYASGDKIKKYIRSMEDKDLEKFVVVKSKLLYIGIDELETEVANKLGLGGGTTQDSSDRQATIDEIKSIVDGVIGNNEENKSKIPVDDNDKLDELEKLQSEGKIQYTNNEDGLIGVRLFDRKGVNLTKGTWNILIEYDSSNKEADRYGSGYYWLKKGTTYIIDGKSLDFKNDYVIDYSKGEYILLSGRSVNWNVKATLGVDYEPALNLDPMTLADGEWVQSDNPEDVDEVNGLPFENFIVTNPDGSKTSNGTQKVGDVVYDDENKALKFNENEMDNPDGEGGYLRLKKDGLDFKNGLTFEMYIHLDRGRYFNKSKKDLDRLGLFVRIKSLKGTFSDSMRFGSTGTWLGRFSSTVTSNDFGNKIKATASSGFEGETVAKVIDDSVGKNLYITISYDANSDMEGYGRIDYYYNGEYFGHGYYASDNYLEGLGYWNNDECPFFIGTCPVGYTGNLYYLKGLVYTTRLYTKSLAPNEVKLNYDMTLKYRDSFMGE